ncbi:ankyrin repeat domain-containing protein [Methylobacter sp. Wu1]|uniref:ankyrin repeat domain-containing protein n=1 Tax=Methylobacter sp. Wu1 TaxID=3119359 RepID=UPI002F9556C7
MQPEITDWLRNHCASAEQNEAGVHPLILACQQGRSDIVEYLLGHGADLNITDQYGNNALWAACYAQDIACIDALLDAGINIDYQNPDSGATALIFAASSGREQVVERLLAAGANPDLKVHDDFTALELASTRKILKLLLTSSQPQSTQ